MNGVARPSTRAAPRERNDWQQDEGHAAHNMQDSEGTTPPTPPPLLLPPRFRREPLSAELGCVQVARALRLLGVAC